MRYVLERDLEPWMPPEDSFLGKYLLYATTRGDSALAWHYLNGLGALAVAMPSNYTIDCLPGGTQYANFWGASVGPPSGHKTSALRMAMKVVSEVMPNRVGTLMGSSEVIVEQFIPPGSTKLLPAMELGNFLAVTGKSEYASTIKPMLTELFDCQPYNRAIRKRSVKIPAPRVSILGAVNEGLLQAFAEPQDWTGGFMSRWCVMCAYPERDDPEEQADPQTFEDACTALKDIIDSKAVAPSGLTDAAWKRFKDWTKELKEIGKATNSDIEASIYGRTPLYAVKIAMLLAADIGAARQGSSWLLDEWELEMGIGLASLARESSLALAAMAQPSRDMRDRAAVLKLLQMAEVKAIEASSRGKSLSPWVPQSQLLRESNLLRQRFSQVIDTLAMEKTITWKTENNDLSYRTIEGQLSEEDYRTDADAAAFALMQATQAMDVD